MLCKVMKRGQIVIPASLRKKYHIEAGDYVQLEDGEEGLKIGHCVRDPVFDGYGIVAGKDSLTDELIQERRKEKD